MLKEAEKKLKEIWSDRRWNALAAQIEIEYWARCLKGRLPDTPPPRGVWATEHRIERFIRALARKTGRGNLHVGLTSSDLEDNIRVRRIKESIDITESSIFFLSGDMMKAENATLVAYTHLLPAGVTTYVDRILPILEAMVVRRKPQIIYKGIGGSLGTRYIQKKLKIKDKEINNIFLLQRERQQEFRHQTGNHVTEHETASWLSFQAAMVAKIANDFRMMFALGQATHIQKDIGSTAIAGKKPNPWRFEKVSGNAEMLYDLPAQISRIASSCLLERTLTNQSVLNRTLEGSFLLFIDLIETLREAINITRIINQEDECRKAKYHSEEAAVDLILKGLSREDAHRKIREQYGT